MTEDQLQERKEIIFDCLDFILRYIELSGQELD